MEAVVLFRRLGSQWRYAPSGRLLGLDYGAVEALFRLERIRERSAVFSRMQVLEAAVIKAERERDSRAVGKPSPWPRPT